MLSLLLLITQPNFQELTTVGIEVENVYNERYLLPLADSYEYSILDPKPVPTLNKYKKLFTEAGLLIQYMEIKRELVTLEDEETLRLWVRMEVIPYLSTEEEEDSLIDHWISSMKEKGFLDIGDGKIHFLRKRLLVHLEKISS